MYIFEYVYVLTLYVQTCFYYYIHMNVYIHSCVYTFVYKILTFIHVCRSYIYV